MLDFDVTSSCEIMLCSYLTLLVGNSVYNHHSTYPDNLRSFFSCTTISNHTFYVVRKSIPSSQVARMIQILIFVVLIQYPLSSIDIAISSIRTKNILKSFEMCIIFCQSFSLISPIVSTVEYSSTHDSYDLRVLNLLNHLGYFDDPSYDFSY